jgi:NADH-quinone oxidoreductase subunit L
VFFDELYNVTVVVPSMWLGASSGSGAMRRRSTASDRWHAALVSAGTHATRRLQSGYLYTYAFVMLIGVSARRHLDHVAVNQLGFPS